MDWRKRIVCNPAVLGGQPAIKGTRLSVTLILDMMAAGATEEYLLANYPHICVDDVRACLRYASESLQPPIKSEIDAWIEGVEFEKRSE